MVTPVKNRTLKMQIHTGSWKRMANGAAFVFFLGLQVNVFIFLGAQQYTNIWFRAHRSLKIISHLTKQGNFFESAFHGGFWYVIGLPLENGKWYHHYTHGYKPIPETFGFWVLWMSALLSGSPCHFPHFSQAVLGKDPWVRKANLFSIDSCPC